jgi:hypothetical protein
MLAIPMGTGRKKPHQRRPRAAATATPPTPPTPEAAVASAPARRDVRPYVYLALNQIFVVVYVYVLVAVIPNRLLSAALHLWALPVLVQLMALGMAARLVGQLRRAGWWLAVVAGSLMILATILLIVRILVSAAFLSGVYGSFGKAAAMSALIGVALVVEIVALVPLFQVKYLMTRAGRRAFAMHAS